ncbi:MAG: F0F1 ATP synthase subunit B [Firmicutes bacterium]|nr:F0F1 ATP synthase subunit B [Bacillota bacterium]
MLRLDINLVFTILNVLILYFLMKKFLFKPVNGVIAKREEEIQKKLSEAEVAKQQAARVNEECAAAVESAKEEAEAIIAEAKNKGRMEYERILSTANEDAAKRMQKAEEMIAEEKEKSLRNMEKEIEALVMTAAAKVVGENVSVESNKSFYDEFIAEMGEDK